MIHAEYLTRVTAKFNQSSRDGMKGRVISEKHIECPAISRGEGIIGKTNKHSELDKPAKPSDLHDLLQSTAIKITNIPLYIFYIQQDIRDLG